MTHIRQVLEGEPIIPKMLSEAQRTIDQANINQLHAPDKSVVENSESPR